MPMSSSAAELDLALPQYDAIPTGSDSIENSYKYLAVNFADGKPETAWLTGFDQREHWARLQWRHRLISINRLKLDCAPMTVVYTPGKAFLDTANPPAQNLTTTLPSSFQVEVHAGSEWRVVKKWDDPVTWDQGKTIITFSQPLEEVNELRIRFRTAAARDLIAVHEVEIEGSPMPTSAAIEPPWQGVWISRPGVPTFASLEATKIYARTVFHIDSKATVRRAALIFAMYDQGKVYLNGKEIGASPYLAGLGVNPEASRVDVDPSSFRDGDNVLGFFDEDLEEAGTIGILGELWIEFQDGTRKVIATDGTQFQAAATPVDGWNESPRPLPWEKAVATNLALPTQVNLLYGLDYPAAFLADPLKLEQVHLEPALPKSGEKYRLSLDLISDRPTTQDYGVVVEYGSKTGVHPDMVDFTLGDSFLPPEACIPKGFSGKKQVVIDGIWPDGTPPRVPIRIRFCNSHVQAALAAVPKGMEQTSPGWAAGFVGAPPPPELAPGFPDARVTKDSRLSVDGKFVAPIIYTSAAVQEPRRYEAWLKTGVELFRIVPQNILRMVGDPSDEERRHGLLLETIRAQVETVRSMNPNAKFLLYLGLDMPNEWKLDHPDSMITMADGSRIMSIDPHNAKNGFQEETPNAPLVLEAVDRSVRHFVERLSREPYAHSIVGVNLSHGRAGEVYWGTDVNLKQNKDDNWIIADRNTTVIGDMGVEARRDFQHWLEKKYGNDANRLAEAWKMPGIHFEDVADEAKFSVKKMNDRIVWRDRPAGRFIFRDEQEEGSFYPDFVQHQDDSRFAIFATAGKAVKEASGGRLIVGGYTGYPIPVITNSPPGAAQHGGGGAALAEILDCPYLDYICSPYFYHMRRAGDPVMPMNVVDSVRLHGKLWMNEYDTRTYLSQIDPKTFSQSESLEVQRKEFGYAITKDQGWWWLEFPYSQVGPQAASWFDDPLLLGEAAVMKQIYDARLRLPPLGPISECAIIFAADQPLRTDFYSPANTVASAMINFLLPKLCKSGASFDLYTQSDLPLLVKKGWYKQYKFVAFVNASYLTPDLRSLIDDKFKKDGRTLAFFYAPGYQGNPGRSLGGIENVIGMKGIGRLAEAHVLGAAFEGAAHSGLDGARPAPFDLNPWWGPEQINNYHQEIGPVFYLDNANANGWENLGFLRLDGKEDRTKSVFAMRKWPDYTVFYSALPDLPIEALSFMVRQSGAHQYTDRRSILSWANPYMICVHAGSLEKNVVVTAPEKVDWIDPFSGKVVATATDRVTIDLEKGQTRFFCLSKGNEWKDLLRPK